MRSKSGMLETTHTHVKIQTHKHKIHKIQTHKHKIQTHKHKIRKYRHTNARYTKYRRTNTRKWCLRHGEVKRKRWQTHCWKRQQCYLYKYAGKWERRWGGKNYPVFPLRKLYTEQMFVLLRTERMQLRNHTDTQNVKPSQR